MLNIHTYVASAMYIPFPVSGSGVPGLGGEQNLASISSASLGMPTRGLLRAFTMSVHVGFGSIRLRNFIIM